MKQLVSRVSAAILAAAVATGCGGPDPGEGLATTQQSVAGTQHATANNPRAGRIRGVVKLAGAAPPMRKLAVGQNQDVCGRDVQVTRVSVGTNQGVQNAFVFLDDVKSGEPFQPRATLEVGQRNCVYTPHSLVVPSSASIEIVNDDAILHNVHARHVAADGLRTVFNIAQPVRGQRTRLDAPFKTTGVVALTCEAGHPWMTAHVLVADHPYVDITDGTGSFEIENVPAGTYPLRMWHEGVQLKQVHERLQRYEYEEPYEMVEQVVVTPGGETTVEFELALRQSS